METKQQSQCLSCGVSWQYFCELLTGEEGKLTDFLREASMLKALFFFCIIIFGCVSYGFTIGVWRSGLMGVYVGVKMPLLILLTLVCNGALNGILAIFLGSGLGVKQSFYALLMSFTILAALLGSLSPVTALLAISAADISMENANLTHNLYLLSHTLIIAISGIIANLHLFRSLRAYCGSRKTASLTLIAWLAGNGFVGAQFSWMLRPFFGSPNLHVEFLRDDALNGSFYEAIFTILKNLISF